MTKLLVSVRSAAEAAIARRGGAALIDVKEPDRGSLGRASDEVIAEVVRTVAGRCPVSAALGELAEQAEMPVEINLDYLKWGLSGIGGNWRTQLRCASEWLAEHRPNCRLVAVAYADGKRASAPPPEGVLALCQQLRLGAFLLDTWKKDGSTLLDWLTVPQLAAMRRSCRAAEIPLALAGSLGREEIQTLLPLRPDWFAVRGAVCKDGKRGAAMDENKVRRLAEEISSATSAG